MTECPYCGGFDTLTPSSDAKHNKPSDQTLCQCSSCKGYVALRRGKVFPMGDRTDPDSGAVNRVVG